MMDAVMMTSEAAAVAATVSATRSDVVERLTAPEEPRSRAAIATIHCPRASLSNCNSLLYINRAECNGLCLFKINSYIWAMKC